MERRKLRILLLCLLVFCLTLPIADLCMGKTKSGLPVDSLVLKDGRLVLRRSGRPLPEGVGTLKPVAHADLRFAIVESSAVEQGKLPVRPGLYLVNANSVVTYFHVPQDGEGSEGWESVVAASLSPDKDILALGYFPTLQGSWYFFRWPDLRPLEHPSTVGYWETDRASPPLLWSDKLQVVVDVMDCEGSKRQCEYDPCGQVSVLAYNLDTGKTSTVFQGTDLCDFHVQSVKEGSVTATKRCLPTVAAWKLFPENGPTETVVAPLP